MTALHVAPLSPNGHLPHAGGDHTLRSLASIANVVGGATIDPLLISTLEGEMSAGTEGGNVEHKLLALLRPEDVGASL